MSEYRKVLGRVGFFWPVYRTTRPYSLRAVSTKGADLNTARQAAQAKELAKDKFDQVRAGAAETAEKVQDKAQEIERSVETFVREQLVKALLIAAGVGVILGRFLMR